MKPPTNAEKKVKVEEKAEEAFLSNALVGVTAWVKNDHLGFKVMYVYRGVVRNFARTSWFGWHRATC
jgi:hypothetical protein